MRLQKFLSRAGVASRREAEGMMAQGRVKVNGRAVVTPGAKVVVGRDRVEVDGRAVTLDPVRWLVLNKPRGVLTTRSDPRGRPTVYSLLPDDSDSLRYVGRLDMNTEGLLIFTNDGDAVHALLHPSSEVSREYRAWVRGVPSDRTLQRLREGVRLEDGMARPEEVQVRRASKERGAIVSLVLREGRKREVRRLLKEVGHPVRRLRRVRFGPLRLEDLKPGDWRELSAPEVRVLRRVAGLPPDRTDVR